MNGQITAEDIRQYQNVPTDIAGRYIGKDAQFVRIGLRMGRLPFGTAVQNVKWSYHVSPGLLIAYQEGTLDIHPILQQEIVTLPKPAWRESQ